MIDLFCCRLKAVNMKVDLYCNGDVDPIDKKLVMQLPQVDKLVLNAKLFPSAVHMPPSPDSSSDSSTDSPHHARLSLTNTTSNSTSSGVTGSESSQSTVTTQQQQQSDAEQQLPGVIMANKDAYLKFIFQVGDLGIKLADELLYQNALELLQVIPPCVQLMSDISALCEEVSASGSFGQVTSDTQLLSRFDSLFYASSSTEIVYSLGIIYTLLMPAENPLSDAALKFQLNFIRSGCGLKILELLVRNNFLSKADELTKMCAALVLLKIIKLLLVIIAHVHISTSTVDASSDLDENGSSRGSAEQVMNNSIDGGNDDPDSGTGGGVAFQKDFFRLRKALQRIPNPSSEYMTIKVAQNVAAHLAESLSAGSRNPLTMTSLGLATLKYRPDLPVIRAVLFLAWTGATGTESAYGFLPEKLHNFIISQKRNTSPYKSSNPQSNDKTVTATDSQTVKSTASMMIYGVSKIAFEVLTIMLMMTPSAIETLTLEAHWKNFICDTALCCLDREVRATAADELSLMLTRCPGQEEGWNGLVTTVTHLKDLLTLMVPVYYSNCKEFFTLFCRLLSAASSLNCQLPFIGELLQMELDILKNVKVSLS